jgi:hypothetical protein
MRNRILMILLVAFSVSAWPETLVYVETTGPDTIVDTYMIKRLDSGYDVKLDSSLNGSPNWDINWQADNSFNTLKWYFRCRREGSDMKAVRDGNKIVLDGVYKNRQVRKEYNLNGHPWKQHFPFGMERDLSETGEFYFWSIGLRGQGELEAGEMKAKVEKKTVMEVGRSEVPVLQVRISLVGWLEPFWHADVYFREEDKRYLKFEAVSGLVGSPLCTVTLKTEAE